MKQKTTLLKKLLQCSCAFVFAISSFNVGAQTLIFSENFNTAILGDNTTLTGSENPYTAANPLVRIAWRSFQAGGAIRMGNGNSSGNLGYIQTVNTLDLSQNGGSFSISFDVKGWTTVENQIMVLVTGQEPRYVTYTATINQPFESVSLNYTGGTINSTVTIETTEKRAFIDNLAIKSTSLGLDSFDKATLKFYPNPVKDILNLTNSEVISSVVVYNLIGQEIMSKKYNDISDQINVSELKTGYYMVKVNSENGSKTVKIAKE